MVAVIYGLTIMGMLSVGYDAGVSGSARSKAAWFLTISFAIVIAMIMAIDRPWGFAKMAQQPLVELRDSIPAESEIPRNEPVIQP